MNKMSWVIGGIIVLAIVAGVLWNSQQSRTVEVMQVSESQVTETDSFDDMRQDLEGTNIFIEDSDYSTVTTDINGL